MDCYIVLFVSHSVCSSVVLLSLCTGPSETALQCLSLESMPLKKRQENKKSDDHFQPSHLGKTFCVNLTVYVVLVIQIWTVFVRNSQVFLVRIWGIVYRILASE